MRLHTMSQNLRRSAGERRGYLLNRRAHVWLWPKGDKSAIFEAGVQLVIPRRPRAEFSFRFHAGTMHSETPWDHHITILGAGVYWNHTALRRLAHFLSRGRSRDLKIARHGSRTYVKLWVPDDYDRGQFAWWRDFSFRLSLLDRIWGPKRYYYETIDIAETVVSLDGDSYPVTLELQTMTLRRVRRSRGRESLVVAWDAPAGIPTQNHDWKGDRSYASSFAIDSREGWKRAAPWLLLKWVAGERARRGYRIPEPSGSSPEVDRG